MSFKGGGRKEQRKERKKKGKREKQSPRTLNQVSVSQCVSPIVDVIVYCLLFTIRTHVSSANVCSWIDSREISWLSDTCFVSSATISITSTLPHIITSSHPHTYMASHTDSSEWWREESEWVCAHREKSRWRLSEQWSSPFICTGLVECGLMYCRLMFCICECFMKWFS